MNADADLLVAGGGPVGLAAAIEARLAGLTVVVVEPRAGAIDKACGEGLMPGALPEFERLGVTLAGRPIRGIVYRSSGRRVDHRFTQRQGLGVRRLALSDALASRAAALGVIRETGRVDEVRQDAAGVSAAGVRARYLIAADGLHSPVRSSLGLDAPMSRPGRRYGLRRHFRVAPWTDLVEVYWTADAEAYVTPVADDTVGLAVLGRKATDFEAVLRSIPPLARRLRSAQPASTLRGAGPFGRRATRHVAGRVLLVGDASGYTDAITGEGIRVGLGQARGAIECITEDRPERYEVEWRRRTRQFRALTTGLVAAATSPLRGAIVPTAAALPPVFDAVVERLAR